MRKHLLIIGALLLASPALADWTGKDAAGSTITFKNPNACTSVVCVPTAQLVDSGGTSIYGTAGSANSNVLTIQGVASMTKLLVTPDSVALPANQSVNEAQINGVTPLMGNGITGTGSQRVTIASDNTAFAVNAASTLTAETTKVIGTVRNIGSAGGAFDAATGAAPPANVLYNGANTGGATGGLVQGMIQCNSTAIYDASTSGSTQIVALAASQIIYVCGYAITVGGTATNVKLIYGTGSNCATGATNLTPAFQFAVNGGIVDKSPFYGGLKTASANALCVNASAANAVQVIVYYAQF